jgi:hypothetical protein
MHRLVSLIGVLAGVIFALPVIAGAAPVSDGHASVMHLKLDVTSQHSTGPLSYQTGVLRSAGKLVGRYQGFCVDVSKQNSQCSFTAKLPGGQIAVQAAYGPGMNSGTAPVDPIVGGTGRYRLARGYVAEQFLSDTEANETLHLVN